MSFLDDILDFGKSALGFVTGNSLGGQLARTALTGYALNKVSNSVTRENATTESKRIDPGVRLQVNPSPEHRVPLVYGRALIGGIVTDAVLTNNSQTMYFVLTICEKTGLTGLGSGAASTFAFKNIYWDGNRVSFQADAVTVSGWTDRAGQTDTNANGKIKIWCYGGNSTTPVAPSPYTPSAALPNAYNVMPNWTASHTMNDLVFAIVQVDYDAEANVKNLGNIKFDIENSMNQPGDCLYDYMSNTRYGAGIDPAEINI